MTTERGWRWFRRPAWICLAAVLCALLCRAADDQDILTRPVRIQRPSALDRFVSRKVADVISLNHYAKHPVDADYSAQWFTEYFRQLDPSRMFFLASDVEDFRSYERVLGDLVLRNTNIDAAFEIYERYLQRVQEWAAYATNRLNQPVDLMGTETIQTDRREAPWAANRGELEELWRRQLINRLLMETLADEAEDASPAPLTPHAELTPAPEADPNAAVEPRPATAATPKRPPVERVAESYRRFLKRKLETDTTEVVELFLNSLTRIYDPHSTYMAPDSEEDFDISMRLSLQGIGAVLTTKDSYVEVLEIVPGGPASRDGRLKPGDRIIAVAQGVEPTKVTDVVDMPLRKVVRMIRGDKGTEVLLTILVAGSSAPTVIGLVRDKVELKEDQARCETRQVPLPDDPEHKTARVAVLTLQSFYLDFEGRRDATENYASCTRDVRLLLEAFAKEPVDGLIVDLRGNGGGALDEAVQLAGFFFGQGPVVQVRDFRGTVKKREDTDASVLYGGPLVLLVDKFSASASEIVAAALQDHGRAVIVGESSTHGKGTVQTVYSLDRQLKQSDLFQGQHGGSVKFTIQKFYRVNGGSTQVKGVVPDLQFPSFTDHMELGEASLPHVLPWDCIEPMTASREVDVAPLLPELKARFEARLQADPEFADLRADIARFAERRKLKELPLSIEARRAFQKEEERWAKKMREPSRRRKAHAGAGDPKANGEAPPDLVLDETVRVMADLIALQRGDIPAATAASTAQPAQPAAEAAVAPEAAPQKAVGE
jgi:carboxyl-terminal processing protease